MSLPELDYMEYANDTVAQATYVSSAAIEYSEDKIPTMTSATTPSGEASASSDSGSSYAGWKAFDDDDDTNWVSANEIVEYVWIKYDFGSDNQKIICKYTIKESISHPERSPEDWLFQGSNNDSDWDTLDTITGETNWSIGEKREFTFSNSTAYRYYRLYITKGYANLRELFIAELEMMEAVDPNFQCYSESTIKSQGSYSLKVVATITDSLNDTLTKTFEGSLTDLCSGGVASASSYYGGYTAGLAFDNDYDTYWLAEVSFPSWIKYNFGFGNAKKITKLTMRCGVYTRAPSDWKFQGSNNDSDWDDLYTKTNELDWNEDEKRTYTFSNSSYYRYYRIYITKVVNSVAREGGTTNYAGQLREVEMMISESQLLDLSDVTDLKLDIRTSRIGTNLQVQLHDSGGTTIVKNINITQVDTFQTTIWDISGIDNSDKDNIDKIIFKILNADSDTTYYIDNFEQLITHDTILSSAFIDNSIKSDSYIIWELEEQINSDANIKAQKVLQDILSSADISLAGEHFSTILSEATIKGIVQNIINSNSHIKGLTQKQILSLAYIRISPYEILSDAWIKRIIEESINAETYIWYYKDFYAKLRAQVEVQKDFNLQLKVNQPVPTDPTNLVATDTQTGESLILSWTDTGNYGYNVYKDVTSVWVKQNDTLIQTNSYVAGSLVTGVNYTFQVRGVNGLGEESAGVNVSGTPTYNIERYTNPSFKIYIGGAYRDDAVLERVEMVYGPSFSSASFYIPKNPSTAGLPEANRQEVKVEINDRLVFTGILIKRSKTYDSSHLRVSYTAIDKLWEKTLHPVGPDVERPEEWPEDLWNPVDVADLTELEFMENSLKYKGNYKIHTDAFGNISYYKLGLPISRRTFEVGKHILRQSLDKDLTNPAKVITVFSEKKRITKCISWKARYWDDIFKPQNIMDVMANEISDVQVFAYVNEKPEVTAHLDVEVLPGHMTKEIWEDGGSEGRFPVKIYRQYSGSWVSISSKVEYSEDGRSATITVLPLPPYWYKRIESGEATFKTIDGEEELYVSIWNEPRHSFAFMKVVYTYKSDRLSKSSGSGIASRTYHENIIPFEISVPANIPYEYVSQNNVVEVNSYLQARAESESARHLEDADKATMTILGDETLALRTQVNGLEVLRVTHDFTTSGFLTHLDLTTKSYYAAVVTLRRKEMLERKSNENINAGNITVLYYDLKKIEAIVGEAKHDPGKEPIAGIASYSD